MTCLKLIGNLSMGMYIYPNWLVSSLVNDFRALSRTAFVLAKLVFQNRVGGGPLLALSRKVAVLHFRLH